MRRRSISELLAGGAAAGALGPVWPSAVAGVAPCVGCAPATLDGRTRRSRGRRSPNGSRAGCSGRFAVLERGRSGPGQADAEPVLHRRPGLGNPEHGMGGRVDLEPERLRGHRRRTPRTSRRRWTSPALHRLRLVVKGGGHSYHGASNAPDSLLVWTRAMEWPVTLQDAFVPRGCEGKYQPGAGGERGGGRALVSRLRRSDPPRGGRYVQGGGCATVGVAGLVQGGGFGSYSKRVGMAAASLLEAEVVTADGARPAGERLHPPGPLLGAEGRWRPAASASSPG